MDQFTSICELMTEEY